MRRHDTAAAHSRQSGNTAQQSNGAAAAEASQPDGSPVAPLGSGTAGDSQSRGLGGIAKPSATPFGLQAQQNRRATPQHPRQQGDEISAAASRAASAAESFSHRRQASLQHSDTQASSSLPTGCFPPLFRAHPTRLRSCCLWWPRLLIINRTIGT